MKVMILNSLYYPHIIGGAEKSTQIIAENLAKSGVETVVVTVSDEERVTEINGVKVYYVYHSSVYWSYYSKMKKVFLKMFWHLISLYNFSILKKLDRIIKKERPEVINTNNLSEFSVGVWKTVKRNRIPVVHTLRDFSLICPRATLFRRKDICRKKNLICIIILNFRKLFTKYVDAVVGNSSFVLEEHLKSGFFTNAKKYVVYNSLESKKIKKSIRKINRKLKFGYIGQLSYHKGIEFLLNVFKQNTVADLHIFGRGITAEYEDFLKQEYGTDKIIFHGYEKIENVFSVIDVLIVPSLCYDVLPRVIYEAYSYGIPVIGSARGGGPEIIDEGKTGFTYSPESGEELLGNIKKFLNNPGMAEEMSKNCLQKAEYFFPEKVLKKYLDIYNNVSKQNG